MAIFSLMWLSYFQRVPFTFDEARSMTTVKPDTRLSRCSTCLQNATLMEGIAKLMVIGWSRWVILGQTIKAAFDYLPWVDTCIRLTSFQGLTRVRPQCPASGIGHLGLARGAWRHHERVSDRWISSCQGLTGVSTVGSIQGSYRNRTHPGWVLSLCPVVGGWKILLGTYIYREKNVATYW